MVELVEQAKCAVDEVVDVMGRATIEAILQLSAEQLAGPKQQGKAANLGVVYHEKRTGQVALYERQLRVQKPRLRKRNTHSGESAEVEVPAYQAMQKEGRLADRMLEIMMDGVSTRRYEEVLPEMAEQVDRRGRFIRNGSCLNKNCEYLFRASLVCRPCRSKSQVSRDFIEAGQRMLRSLAEKDLSELDILVVYIEGIQFGRYHVICAMGVDSSGHKHVLGQREGATGNAEVATALLEDLAGRGLDAFARRLFVIDGAKALRKAINRVFGDNQPVQPASPVCSPREVSDFRRRCGMSKRLFQTARGGRNHKQRNVPGHLPKDQHDQAKSTIKAAWKLDADEGMAKPKQYAEWLERDWPAAAGSLREGLSEMFTINRLGLLSQLRLCLGTTNVIDNGRSAIRHRTQRVKNWQNGTMALRWTAAAFEASSKNYRRIMGYEQLWILKAALEEPIKDEQLGLIR
jgi:putative transposase